MSDIRLDYHFNTLLFVINKDDGTFPETEHKAFALKFRGYLCNLVNGDGISNVKVNSDGFTLEMDTAMTTIATVDTAVAATMAWALEQHTGIFPLRGDKTPTATRTNYTDKVKAPSTIVKLFAHFETDLYPYPLSSDERHEWEDTLARLLVQFDGALNYGIAMRTVVLKFDRSQRTLREAEDHLEEVLTIAASDKMPGYFPFVDDERLPRLRFETVDVDS